MSSPPIVARSGTLVTDAARLMDVESVRRLPVVDGEDRLAGMVTRGDLLKIHLRPDEEILQDIMEDILRGTLSDEFQQVRAEVDEGTVTLVGRVERWSTGDLLAGSPGRSPVSSE